MKYEYNYNGPVLYFNKAFPHKWKGKTIAVSKKKALSNLAYQIKKEAKLGPDAKITLVEKYLTVGDSVF